MMKLIRLSRIIFFLAILFSCEEDPETETLYVKTGEALVSASGGVVLQGSLSAFQKIEDHGFILTPQGSVSFTYTYSLGRPGASGSFEKALDTDLDSQSYSYKAYLRIGNEYFFGGSRFFTYIKNKPPVIESVSPTIGHIEDTVIITGKNFSKSIYNNHVYFGSAKADVIESANDRIKCVVPEEILVGNSVVSVELGGVKVNSPETFQLYGPQITGLSPSSSSIRGILEIDGDHFDLKDERNAVKFETTAAIVVFSSRTKIKVIVPDNLENAISSITVFTQKKLITSPVQFTLKAPEITQAPLKGLTMDIIALTGNGFHPLYYKNKVYFGNAEAEVLSSSSVTQLNVKVPLGPYVKRDTGIKVDVLGIQSTQVIPFLIDDPWLMVTDNLPFSYYGSIGAFELNGKAHIIAPPKGGGETPFLWIMDDTENFTWTKYPIPVSLKWSGIGMANGSKAYLYTATASDNFWEYDGATGTWTAVANFPGGRRDKPGMFTIGEDVYIGWGSDFEPYNVIGFVDFYRYSPAANSWEQIADLNSPSMYTGRTETSTFTIDGLGYIGCGARTTGQYDFWRYDPAANLWSRMADFGPKSYTASFQINGKGYIANGGYTDCWEYNPATNTWRQVDNIGHHGRYRGFAFVLNGVPFVGGGEGAIYEMYMLDAGRMK